MSGRRRLKVEVRSPDGIVYFDAEKKEIRLSGRPEEELSLPPPAGEKSRELFRYSDPDRIIRIYLLYLPSVTLIGSLTLLPGSPGERALTELLRNRRMQGREYDLAQMMSELTAEQYRRHFGDNSARAAAAGEEGYFCWSVPTVDLGAPRVLVFSSADTMYFSGCCPSFSAELLTEELTVACGSLTIVYQCHLTMCEFFDLFADAWTEARRKGRQFFPEVPAARPLMKAMDANKTRKFFSRMDRVCQLRQKIQHQEETLEKRLWHELITSGKQESPLSPDAEEGES